jgi:hypothetical protein
MPVMQEMMDRQQLDRRDPKFFRCWMTGAEAKTGKGAAEMLGNFRMQLRQSAHVPHKSRSCASEFGGTIVSPSERRIDHGREGCKGCTVPLVEGKILSASPIRYPNRESSQRVRRAISLA